MYLSGGVGSGLGVVILVAVAAGSVLVTGRVSAFHRGGREHRGALRRVLRLVDAAGLSAATTFRPASSARSILRRRLRSRRCRRGCGEPKSRRCRARPKSPTSNASIGRSFSGCAPASSSSTPTIIRGVLNQSARRCSASADKRRIDAGPAASACSNDLRAWRADTQRAGRTVRDRADHARDPRQLQRCQAGTTRRRRHRLSRRHRGNPTAGPAIEARRARSAFREHRARNPQSARRDQPRRSTAQRIPQPRQR